MSKNKKNNEQVVEIDKLWEDTKGTNPQQILIISFDDNGVMNFNTNIPNYPFLHYSMNRAVMEILLHERSQKEASQEVGS